MDAKARWKIQLDCLYDMFRDRIEENVIYIVYSENEGKIHQTIDQLMPIANSSFTGHNFEPKPPLAQACNNLQGGRKTLNSEPCAIVSNRLGSPSHAQNLECANVPIKQQQQKHLTTTEKNPTENDLEQNPTGETAIDKEILTIEEQIERLQSSIGELLVEKNSSHDKAAQYLSKKMYPVTSYYSTLASQLRKMIDDKTNQLVELLLQKCDNSSQIDLHGLNPVQARLVVSELLRIRQSKLMIDKQGETSIDIITGWGKHSNTHGQRIRPAIVALLRENGFEYHRLNKGALRVTVRRC